MANYSQTCSVSLFCCSTVLFSFSSCSFISPIFFISLMFSLSFSLHSSCTNKQSLLDPESCRCSVLHMEEWDEALRTFRLTTSWCCFSSRLLRASFSSVSRSSSFCSSVFSRTFCSTCSCTQANRLCFIDLSPGTSTLARRCCELDGLLTHLRRDHQQVVVLTNALQAMLSHLPETEGGARPSNLTAAVHVAELVELHLVFREVVIWRNR